MITELRSLERSYTMERLYQTIGRSRQQYAQKIKQQTIDIINEQRVLQALICWREHHPRMGSRSSYHSLKNAGVDIDMGITKFEQLVSRNGLTIGKIRKSGPYTSDGKGKESYPNLTNGLVLNDINQLVVGDITYYWVDSNWHYIFTLKDVYSQKIISLIPSQNMKMENGLKCIEALITQRGRENLVQCIHHTDNGSQYNAGIYKKEIIDLRMRISRSDSCKENGSAEQLNHIIKNMYLDGWAIDTFKQLKEACKEVTYLSNEKRAIKQLGYISPCEFERNLKTIPKCDHPKKVLHTFKK